MAGCAALDSDGQGANSTVQRDPALVELGNGMQQCLENQASTQEQLRIQQQQLERQQQQLEALAGEVRAAGRTDAEVDPVIPVPGSM